eukprot:5402578-Pleurochrysis_carterae.AAC.3
MLRPEALLARVRRKLRAMLGVHSRGVFLAYELVWRLSHLRARLENGTRHSGLERKLTTSPATDSLFIALNQSVCVNRSQKYSKEMTSHSSRSCSGHGASFPAPPCAAVTPTLRRHAVHRAAAAALHRVVQHGTRALLRLSNATAR